MQTEFGSTIGSFSAEGGRTFIASREIAGLTVDRICGNADEGGRGRKNLCGLKSVRQCLVDYY